MEFVLCSVHILMAEWLYINQIETIQNKVIPQNQMLSATRHIFHS